MYRNHSYLYCKMTKITGVELQVNYLKRYKL